MEEKYPLISVIMSEYNTDINLLNESIKSILNQTYKNFELIIIDDCGSNDVGEVVKKFNDTRIKVYKNECNKGLVYSLNRAIDLCEGNYIARMDTDDYSYPNRLEVQIDFMLNNPEYDIVGSRCEYFDGNEIWGENKDFGIITREKILRGCPLTHPSLMYKKQCMQSVGGYLNYIRCEDYATWIELFSKGYKMFIINEVLLRFHLSLNDYKKRNLKSRKGFFQVLKTEYKKLNPSRKDIFKIYLKNIIAGVIPGKMLYSYQKRVFKKGSF